MRCAANCLPLAAKVRFEALEAVQFIAFKGAAQAIGPVTSERAVLGGKRVLSNYFLLLPTGGDPIKLEYLDKPAAAEARVQLLTSPGTHRVASTKLLQAIHVAIQAMKWDGDESLKPVANR